MGLKAFLVADEGEFIQVPQYYRKAQKKLKRLQRSVSRKKKKSNRRKKAIKRLARAHLKVANQRKDFHYHNAAINIKHRAVEHLVLKAQEMSDAIAGVTEKPTLYASA